LTNLQSMLQRNKLEETFTHRQSDKSTLNLYITAKKI